MIEIHRKIQFVSVFTQAYSLPRSWPRTTAQHDSITGWAAITDSSWSKLIKQKLETIRIFTITNSTIPTASQALLLAQLDFIVASGNLGLLL